LVDGFAEAKERDPVKSFFQNNIALREFLLLDTVESFYTADLFQIETSSGLKMYATDGQLGITYNGNRYEPVKYGIWKRGTVTTKLGMTSSTMDFTVMADGSPMQGNVEQWPTGQARSQEINFTTDPSTWPGQLFPGVSGNQYLYGRVTGIISPNQTANYTFNLHSDDFGSLYINGQTVCSSTPSAIAVGNFDMVEGQIYDIVATVNNDGLVRSALNVTWAPGSQPQEFVPPAPGTFFTFKTWAMTGPSTSGGYPTNGGAATVPSSLEISLLQAIQLGLFDGAKITVYTTYMPDYGDLRYGVETKYSGQITELDKTGRTTAEGTAESYLFKLNQQMPRMLLQPGCRWVLGDAGCTLDLQSHPNNPLIQTGVVSSASTSLQIQSQTPLTQADDYFTQGIITMTSGQNMGLSMSVKQYKGGVIVLTRPFLFMVATGDQFRVTAGCDHTFSTCQTKFGNLANFGGMPFVPSYERAL
jgi:uncharacterized phage protein (TIGR02218 family)